MNRFDTLRRGELNVADAAFVRDRVIPAAMESARWNIVVFESFRVVELVMKGMVCLSGHAPRQSHEIDLLVDDFLELLAKQPDSLPFLYSVVSPDGNAYGVYWSGESLQLLRRVHGLYTLMASSGRAIVPSIDRLLRLRVEVVGFRVSVYFENEVVLETSDASIANAGRFTRSFERAPNMTAVGELKRVAARLRISREDAFFGTVLYTETDAEEAVALMNAALSASTSFVAQA